MNSRAAAVVDRLSPVAVGATLAIGNLGNWSLWQDEAFSWVVSHKDAAGMIAAAGADRHPPLYYLLASPFARVADRDEWLRLPSALAFLAAIVLVRRAGERALGPEAGRAAAWILALSPFAVLYADTARMYGMLLGWGALLLAGSVDVALGAATVPAAIAVGVGAAGAIWTHYAGAGAIVGAALGGTLGLSLRADLSWRDRARRTAVLGTALAVAGASFLPWATGPLQYQLANKDVPMDRTLSVLAYLGWNFDTRIPSLSWAMFALQPFGLFAVLRRGGPVAGVAAGWAVAATLFPWWMSQSLPAQNPRNQVDFLPAGALLAAWGAMTVAAPIATRLRVAAVSTSWAVVAAFLVLSAEPLADLLCRPVSPQETGAGFDYQVEANVFDTSIPKNAGFHFRPAYMRTQYGRYADGVFARGEIRLDERSAIATARAEWLDPRVSSRFTEECVFTRAFRVLLYLPSGPGCTAAKAWVGALADAGYAPALLEEGGRAKDRGDLAEAEAMLLRAAGTVRAHPVAWLALGNVREQRMDAAGMLVAADRAVAVAKEWHFPGPTIAEALRLRARALAMLGHKEEGEATLATATCAKGARFPTFCGTPLQRLAGTLGPASGSPLPPLPALAESQQPAPPEAPPAWTTRLALWTLDGEVLPADWFHGSTPGGTPRAWLDPTPGGAVLVLAADPGEPVALACAPLLPASARMALRMRWKLDAEDPTQRGRFTVEARMADAGGKVRTVLGTPVAERVVQAGTTTPWRVDRFDFRAPNAAQVRLCLKAEAPGRIRATVDWVEALRVTEGGGP